MKRPDLFIVGAFKAGTTSLYEYLRGHPQVFMSVPKEPMYFGADLTPRYRRMSEPEYLALFRDARADQRAGEASPWYLYSSSAAAEIKAFEPGARIVIMLRNPIDVMFSQHSQLVFNQREDLADLARPWTPNQTGWRATGYPPMPSDLKPSTTVARCDFRNRCGATSRSLGARRSTSSSLMISSPTRPACTARRSSSWA